MSHNLKVTDFPDKGSWGPERWGGWFAKVISQWKQKLALLPRAPRPPRWWVLLNIGQHRAGCLAGGAWGQPGITWGEPPALLLLHASHYCITVTARGPGPASPGCPGCFPSCRRRGRATRIGSARVQLSRYRTPPTWLPGPGGGGREERGAGRGRQLISRWSNPEGWRTGGSDWAWGPRCLK